MRKTKLHSFLRVAGSIFTSWKSFVVNLFKRIKEQEGRIVRYQSESVTIFNKYKKNTLQFQRLELGVKSSEFKYEIHKSLFRL